MDKQKKKGGGDVTKTAVIRGDRVLLAAAMRRRWMDGVSFIKGKQRRLVGEWAHDGK